MTGSVKKRGKTWTIIYDNGLKWNESRGELVRNQVWEKVPPPNTKQHAEQLLRERLSQIDRGESVILKKITFSDFVDLWIEQYAAIHMRESTCEKNRSIFRTHLKPTFGGRQIQTIRTGDIQEYKARRLSLGLSPGYVKQHLALLRQMFAHAVDWEYLRRNPAEKVRDPIVPKPQVTVLNPDEVKRLLNAVQGKQHALLLTAIVSGMRIGELLAMRWEHLDTDLGRYAVHETLARKTQNEPVRFTPPKTRESRQSVDLTTGCIKTLSEHKRLQTLSRLAVGGKYVDLGLVFCTELGRPLDHHNVTRRWLKPALAAASLPAIRFHDLRHTCASLLIAQGENPKYVQRQMRHASIEQTFDRYGHLFPEQRDQAMNRMNQMLEC